MREILFKNLTSQDKKHRNFSVCEELEQDGFMTTAEKNWGYDITSHTKFSSLPQIKKWIDCQNNKQDKIKREIYVKRICDRTQQKENLSCKICGEFYVVLGFDIFCVKFNHTLVLNHTPVGKGGV